MMAGVSRHFAVFAHGVQFAWGAVAQMPHHGLNLTLELTRDALVALAGADALTSR